MAKKTLYISDLDGTLLQGNKEISSFARETLNSLFAKGVYFSIATARTVATVTKILAGLEINVPVILLNGAAIYDMINNTYINIEKIPQAAGCSICKVLQEQQITGFMYCISENQLHAYYEVLNTEALQKYHHERVSKYGKSFEQAAAFADKLKDNEVIYFTLMNTEERLREIAKELTMPGIGMVLSSDVYVKDLWYLEIYGENASKYNAVKYLRDYLGFDRVIGFGDNTNDLPLLRACDEFYAVANAVPVVKEQATQVIGDNRSDAVVKFIVSKQAIKD